MGVFYSRPDPAEADLPEPDTMPNEEEFHTARDSVGGAPPVTNDSKDDTPIVAKDSGKEDPIVTKESETAETKESETAITKESETAITKDSEAAKQFGSESHLAKFWDELNEEQRKALVDQFNSIDLPDVKKCFEVSAHPKPLSKLEKIDELQYAIVSGICPETMEMLWCKGLEAIAEGKVAAIVLAGGQATRLGALHPKGTLSLGLEGFAGTDSLLSLQAARIARLQKLAHEKYSELNGLIQWVVMTSVATEAETREHLEKIVPENGLTMDQVTVFNQGEFPCFDLDGNFILSEKAKIAMAPDGNGGLYSSLASYLPQLRSRGVEYVHVYCVDNVLCRVADPHFIGFCICKEADCAAKAVKKVDPNEAVGVICLEKGRAKVVEYSEISKELAEMRNDKGELVFRAGNIANHFFKMNFLERVCSKECRLQYHRALKKIPYIADDGTLVKPETPNGIKLEQFVFDVFEYSFNFFAWEVKREEEFSPLKNSEKTGTDCVSTCRRDLAAENRRWLKEAGAKITGDEVVFIHPSRSYAGENLEEFADTEVGSHFVIQ